MGYFAIACDFALKGATQEELSYVRSIIEENYEKNKDAGGFLPGEGHGSVIMLDSLDDQADYDIGLDLSKNGVITVKSMDSQRVGSISYDLDDRRNLLYQLIIMQIGFKFADVPFKDIMDMFEKGCVFRHIDCSKDDYMSLLTNILGESTQEKTINQNVVFVQLIDPPEVMTVLETDELLNEFGFNTCWIQVITHNDDLYSFKSGVFTLK